MKKDTQKTNVIQKPDTLLKEDFTVNMLNLINNSGLSLMIIEPVLRDVLREVQIQLNNQCVFDKAQYEQALMEIENGEKDDRKTVPEKNGKDKIKK